jgi:hypothetical protein
MKNAIKGFEQFICVNRGWWGGLSVLIMALE